MNFVAMLTPMSTDCDAAMVMNQGFKDGADEF